MTFGAKDSPEVIAFMTLFARLKEWSDGEPDRLPEFARQDESIRQLCLEIYFQADTLNKNARRHREMYAAPVDPKFASAWREYEENYETFVLHAWLAVSLENEDGPDNEGKTGERPGLDFLWDNADSYAKEQAQIIEDAITFADQEAEDELREFPDGFRERINDSLIVWLQLKQSAGLQVRGVIRRRELIPFILIPRHVSERYGNSDRLSLLQNLREAHDAFVFGTPYAALALMRSILEAVLRDHYGAEGGSLEERIKKVGKQLPDGISEAALHRLRKWANAVLHLESDEKGQLNRFDERGLELEIVSLLVVLRGLVEAAPSRRNF